MALNPEVRLERFLAGQNLTPAVRLEYFLAGAAGYGLAALQDEAAPIAAGGTAIATIPDAADNVPLQSLLVQVDPLQEGSGTPSPDNERPIVPRESVEVVITGGNAERTATAKLPENFYSGCVDVVKGAVYSNSVMLTFNEAMLYGEYAGHPLYYCEIPEGVSIAEKSVSYDPGKLVSNYFIETVSTTTDGMADLSIRTNAGTPSKIYFRYDSADDLDAINAMFAETPLQVLAELNTPVELDIDPVSILTLKGINNISADSGNVLAIEYKQDPEASANDIKALIAPVLPEMKADANLTANDFRIVGNTLYKITASIAAGGTLTPGSNCTATTVGAQLKALL